MQNSLTLGKKVLTVVVVAATIVWTLGVAAFAVPSTANAASMGSLVKSASLSAVYYYGTDGQRYTFPNLKTYETWYSDFSGVMTISDSELAAIPLAGNVVYRPGSRFVKIQSDPKTYAVTPSGALRWIETEAVAMGLAGSAWNTYIDDVPEVFFVDYSVGSSLMSAAAYNGMLVMSAGSKYVVSGSSKRLVTSAGQSANRYQDRFFVSSSSDLLASLSAGADVTGVDATLNDPAQLGGSSSTPVAGGLSVSLASDTPASMSVADGASQVRLMKFNLAASGGNATVTSVTLKLAGLGATTNISSLYLFEGLTRLTSGRAVNSTTRTATFGGMSLAVTSGQTRVITVVADMANGINGGDTMLFQIESAASIASNATVSGSFPVTGNSMETSATDVGLLTVTDTGTISNPKVGEIAKIANFRLAANSTEGFGLQRLRLEVDRASDHSGYELRQAGSVIANGTVSGSSYVDFALATPFAIAQGNNREFDVYAKVGGDNSDGLRVRIEETTDIYAVGDKYGFGVRVASTSGVVDGLGTAFGTCTSDASGYDCSQVQAGQLTFAFNGPSTGDIAENKIGVVLWSGAITAQNLVEIRDLEFDIAGGSGTADLFTDLDADSAACESNEHNYQNFRLVRKDTGATISGPVAMSSCAETTATIDLVDDFSIPAGETWDVQLLTDVQDDGTYTDILAGDTIRAVLDVSETVARDANNKAMSVSTDIIPTSDLTGNTQTIRTSSLSVSVASNPASSTYVKGTSNVDVVGYAFAAGTASPVTVSAITLKGVMDAAATSLTDIGGLTVRDGVNSCSLYDGGTGALIDGPESFATGNAADITFNGFSWTVPAASTYRMIVRCNLANYTVNGAADGLYLEIDEDDDISSVDGDGNSVVETTGGSTISSSNEVNDDGASVFQTIANAGTLTVALDGDSPNSTILLSNSTGITVSKFRFTSSNEAFTVDRMGVSNTGGSDVAVSSVELHYKDSAGADKVATGFLTSNVYIFEGLTFYVPKDSTAVVTVKVNTGDVSAANSASGDLVGIDFDVDTSANDQFRAVGSGSGTTLNDTGSSMADTAGSNHEIRKTKPTISLASGSPSGAAIAGLIEVLRFNVTADSRGDVALSEVTFELSSTDNATNTWNTCGSGDLAVGDIYLYDSTDTSTDLASDTDVSLIDSAGVACGSSAVVKFINVNFDGDSGVEQSIAAGTTKTYIMKINVSNAASPSAVQDDSMRVDIPDEVSFDAATATTDWDSIVWNDSNATSGNMDNNSIGAGANDRNGTGASSNNGIDGDMLKNLPVIGGSLIF